MLNVFVGIGRLCKDPELRYGQSGKAICTLRVAFDRGTTNPQGQRETDFLNVVTFDKQAENCANYLQSGRLIGVRGRVQVRQWEQDGQKREKAEIVASEIKFLDKGQDQGGNHSGGGGGGDGQALDLGSDDDVPF